MVAVNKWRGALAGPFLALRKPSSGGHCCKSGTALTNLWLGAKSSLFLRVSVMAGSTDFQIEGSQNQHADSVQA